MSRTVLLVEDSASQAQHIAEQLTQQGYKVITAQDGLEGLRMVDLTQPDTVILDVWLPDMDGFQICRRLKRDSRTADIPVILLTSASTIQEIHTGYSAGAYAYIPKGTFAIQHLVETLRRVSNRPNSD